MYWGGGFGVRTVVRGWVWWLMVVGFFLEPTVWNQNGLSVVLAPVDVWHHMYIHVLMYTNTHVHVSEVNLSVLAVCVSVCVLYF